MESASYEGAGCGGGEGGPELDLGGLWCSGGGRWSRGRAFYGCGGGCWRYRGGGA